MVWIVFDPIDAILKGNHSKIRQSTPEKVPACLRVVASSAILILRTPLVDPRKDGEGDECFNVHSVQSSKFLALG
mgnify:CR=1 FL=1